MNNDKMRDLQQITHNGKGTYCPLIDKCVGSLDELETECKGLYSYCPEYQEAVKNGEINATFAFKMKIIHDKKLLKIYGKCLR